MKNNLFIMSLLMIISSNAIAIDLSSPAALDNVNIDDPKEREQAEAELRKKVKIEFGEFHKSVPKERIEDLISNVVRNNNRVLQEIDSTNLALQSSSNSPEEQKALRRQLWKLEQQRSAINEAIEIINDAYDYDQFRVK